MVAEMRMIWWICGYTCLDKIRNVVFREKVGAAPIEEKMRETRLRWFGHIKRRSVEAPIRKCEMIDLRHYRRGRGRPKTSCNEVIRSDLDFIGLTEDMVQDRSLWRFRIKTVDHRLRVSCPLPWNSMLVVEGWHIELAISRACVGVFILRGVLSC